MWRPWAKPPPRNHDSSPPPGTSFSFSTFKDIHLLCTDDSISSPQISRKPAIFHRACAATTLVRSWSNLRISSENSLPPQFVPQLSSLSTEESLERILRTVSEPQTLLDLQLEQSQVGSNAETSNQILTSQSESKSERNVEPEPTSSTPSITLPGSEKRIVVYFTSLHVIRPTFEDCRTVRSIIQGFRVPIEERDLSMDSGFLKELQEILGQDESKLRLPRVFIGGRYIGGAEEIRQLNETGELKKLVAGLPAVDSGVCDACGGHSFVLCKVCRGSHKVYTEKSGLRSCTACNENGIIRCSSCPYAQQL